MAVSLKGIPEQGIQPEPHEVPRPNQPHSAAVRQPRAVSDEEWRLRGQEVLMSIPVSVRIVLGSARMPFAKLMGLARGSVIPLDRKVGDLVDIVVNDRLVARGEVVVLDDDAERFAIAVREVIRPSEG